MKIFGLTFLIFGFATSILSAQIIIDDFNSGAPLVQQGPGTNTQIIFGPGILGDQRDETVTAQFIGTLAANNGALIVQQGPTDQISGSIVYDDFPVVDLTSGGQSSSFALDFVSSDAPTPLSNVLSIIVTSGGNSATSFVTVPSTNNLGVATVDFASFSGVDFTSVDSISLVFDFATEPGRDFSIDTFETVATVPEPTGFGLCCLVAIGNLLRRRRTQQSSH